MLTVMFTHPSSINLIWCFICFLHLKVHSGKKSNNVMFAESDPSPPSTSYGALYLASLVYVYEGPLGLWVKVIQFI